MTEVGVAPALPSAVDTLFDAELRRQLVELRRPL